jgi:aminoglycoside 3-N-acetyltransferase
MQYITIKELSDNTKNRPIIIHINPLGLLRIGLNNEDRFSNLNVILNQIQSNGGNVAIPVYSYSYAKNEVYDILNIPTTLDEVSEYLRKNNKTKRTIDANFSYLLFGNDFENKHFSVSDYSSFGEGSLIEEVFDKDGYLAVIGGVLEYLTEIHFLEKKLNVNYRFDKVFSGITIDKNGNKINNKMTYYCRDLDSSYSSSLAQLKKDIKLTGLIKIWKLKEFNLKIEVVKIQELLNFVKEKLEKDSKYLWKSCGYE